MRLAIFSLYISSSYVRIKLHTERQLSSLLISWDSYEEDLKIRFGKWPQHNYNLYSRNFFKLCKNQSALKQGGSRKEGRNEKKNCDFKASLDVNEGLISFSSILQLISSWQLEFQGDRC